MINTVIILVLASALAFYIAKYCRLKKDVKDFNEKLKKKIKYNSISKNEVYRDKDLAELAESIETMLENSNRIKNEFNEIVREDRELMANISHDLRTPLTSVIGYLSLIENEKDSDEIRRYIETAKAKSDYLNELIEKFYELSLVLNNDGTEEKKYINLSEFVFGTAFEYYDIFESMNESFEARTCSEDIEIFTSEKMMSAVVHNILDNMVKYSEGDNSIEILKNENIEIVFSNKCSLTDGDDYSYLFRRLAVADASRKNSTGIGLAVVKASTEKLGYQCSICVKNGKFILKIEIPV